VAMGWRCGMSQNVDFLRLHRLFWIGPNGRFLFFFSWNSLSRVRA
jgi:hypothetical protein